MESYDHFRCAGCQPDAYFVPDCLCKAQYEGLPLYLLVAWWVYLQESPVTTRAVSEAFHISARRAGDALLYLLHADNVQCFRVWDSQTQGLRRRVWEVTVVGDAPVSQRQTTPPVMPAVKKNPVRRQPQSQLLRDMRSWVVSRRVGETVPDQSFYSHCQKAK